MLRSLIILIMFLMNMFVLQSEVVIKETNTDVYEYNNQGENVVDSVVNYYKSGAATYQFVHYSDGTIQMFDRWLGIKDLKRRQVYIDFENQYPGTLYPNYPIPHKAYIGLHDYLESNLIKEFEAFNDYLLENDMIPIMDIYRYCTITKNKSFTLILEEARLEDSNGLLVILLPMILLLMTAASLITYTVVKNPPGIKRGEDSS